MVKYGLLAKYDTRKSFYNKAVVIEDGDRKTLESYNTKVCTLGGTGHFARLWNGYSATTMRHINEFRLQNGLDAMSKKDWEKLEVE